MCGALPFVSLSPGERGGVRAQPRGTWRSRARKACRARRPSPSRYAGPSLSRGHGRGDVCGALALGLPLPGGEGRGEGVFAPPSLSVPAMTGSGPGDWPDEKGPAGAGPRKPRTRRGDLAVRPPAAHPSARPWPRSHRTRRRWESAAAASCLGIFGKVTVSTPSAKLASTRSATTSASIGIRRSKAP